MNSGANGKIFIEKDPPSEPSNTQTFGQRIVDYLAYLKEQLNFIFSNYGRRLVDAADNVNELTRTATETTSRISDAEGDISTLQQTAQGLTSTVSDLRGNVTTLQETATGLTSQVSGLNGRVSTVEQTADGLTTRVGTAEGNISSLQQTASGLQSRVSTAEGDISTLTQTATGLESRVSSAEANAAVVNLMPSIYYREAISDNPWVSTSGITWTVNPDGSITATGTASSESIYSIANSSMSAVVPPIKVDPTRDYTISGIPGVSGCRLYFVKYDASGAQIGSQGYIQNAASAVISAGADYISCFAYIVSGTVLPEGGVTFRPQLEVGSRSHGYVSTHGGSYAMQSSIRQNANEIELKVSSTDYTGAKIASKINQSASTVQIEAQHINLTGAVTISSLDSTTQAALLTGTTVKTQYYLSTSASSAKDGTWYDSPNSITWASGTYVWTRVATTKTFASGTSTTTYSTAVYDKQLTSALSTSASAVSAAGAAQTTANATVTEAIPIYYRSMSSTTPTLVPGETYVYITDNTDDQWSAVAPRPKKNAYFWEAVRYTLGDGSRAYSLVRALTSEQYASKWVSTADSAYIDGGAIYAHSVTADQISVSDLKALNATISGWTIGTSAIYKNITSGETTYQVGINSPTASENTAAFYIEKREGSDPATYPFLVRNNGKLIATDATITGNITATSLTLGSGVSVAASKVSGLSTVATSGSYSDLSSKPDLTVYVQKDGTIGTTPAEGVTGFNVSSAGLLTASNAVIYGTVYATDGTFTGTITSSNATITGGSVNISTDSRSNNQVSLNYESGGVTRSSQLSAYSGLRLSYSDSSYSDYTLVNHSGLHLAYNPDSSDYADYGKSFLIIGDRSAGRVYADKVSVSIQDSSFTKLAELTNSGLVFRNTSDAVTAQYPATGLYAYNLRNSLVTTLPASGTKTITFSGQTVAIISVTSGYQQGYATYVYNGYGTGTARQHIAELHSGTSITYAIDASAQKVTISNGIASTMNLTIVVLYGANKPTVA